MNEFRRLNYEDHASLYASYDLQEAVKRSMQSRSLRDNEGDILPVKPVVAWSTLIVVVTFLFFSLL